ncbi:MAG: multidrug effflux MFS transporter [Pseudomonadota bacterium]
MVSASLSSSRFATLVLLTGLSVLPLSIFLPSLPNIATDLDTTYALVSLSVSGYLATTAILQLMIGPLSDRFGRRPVLLVCMTLFALASLGCALVTNIWGFLAFRVVQGAVIAGYTLSLAVIRDTTSAENAAGLIGYVSMVMAVAPMTGPMIGGFLDEFFGWRASFTSLFVIGASALLICWYRLDETNRTPSDTLLAQVKSYPVLARSKRFWGYTLCMTFSIGAFYSFLAGAPLVAGAMLRMPPSELGFYMGTITAGFMVGSFLAGRYAKHHALTTTMIAGRIAACIGLTAGLVFYAAGIVHVVSFFGATIFLGFGNGLTIPSSNAGALSAVPHLIGSASGLSGAITVGGGALLMTITGSVLTERNAVFGVLAMMLLCTLIGLIAALYVRRIEGAEASR